MKRDIWDTIIGNRVFFLSSFFVILFILLSFTVPGFLNLYNLTNMTQY